MNSNKPKAPGKIIFMALLFLGITCLFISFVLFVLELWFPVFASLFILSFVLIIGAVAFAHTVAPKLNGKALDKYLSLLPEIKVPAKVALKNTSTQSQASFNRAGFVVASVFNITFEFADKQRLVFRFDEQLFNTILENEEGTLTYKEGGGRKYFISFEPN